MAEMEKLRADVALCTRGLAPSRERARALIEAGLVYADGAQVKKGVWIHNIVSGKEIQVN